jgi:hypothetical protein
MKKRIVRGLLPVLMVLSAVPAWAGSFTDYFEARIVAHMLAGEAFTPASTYYVALFTVAPGEATAGTEATGGSYARQSFTFSRTGSVAANTSVIEFPVSTADRGNIVAVGFFDAATDGNLCGYHVLSTARQYNVGQTLRFPVGTLTSSVD